MCLGELAIYGISFLQTNTQGLKKVQSSSLGQIDFLAGQATFKHLPNHGQGSKLVNHLLVKSLTKMGKK